MQGAFDPALFVQIGEAVLRNEKLASFIEYLTSTKRNRTDIKREAKDHVYDADFGRWAETHGAKPELYIDTAVKPEQPVTVGAWD